MNIPLNHLQERIGEVPRIRRIAVYCAGGYQSSIAAILHQHGIANLKELAGGLAAWDAAALNFAPSDIAPLDLAAHAR